MPRPTLADVTPKAKPAPARSRALLLLERLEKGDDFEVVTWPTADPGDADARFAMVGLSDSELQYAYAAAHERMRELKIELSMFTASELHDETATQILARSMRVLGEDGRPTRETLFASADEFRDALRGPSRSQTRNALIEAYSRLAEPEAELTEELVAEIVELAKKKDVVRLSRYASAHLAVALAGMAAPSSSSPTGSS